MAPRPAHRTTLDRRTLLTRLAGAAAAAALPFGATAQSFPAKPVTIVVSYPAGGIADLLARQLAQQLSKAWGQSVLVDNRPGGNQIIAASSVMKAPADGYTLLLCDDGVFTLNPHLFKSLPYDLKDFTPVVDLADAKIVLSMAKEVPASNLPGMISYAKANPGKLNYASLGVGNIHHLMLETIKKQAGIDLVHVPYKGYAQAIQDVLANRAQLVSGGIGGPVLQHLGNGSLKALAVTGTTRSPLIPNVPTFAEAGLPQVQPKVHFVLMGPAGMPAALVERVNSTVSPLLKGELSTTLLAPNGLDALGNKPDVFANQLKEGRQAYGPIVKEIGVTLD